MDNYYDREFNYPCGKHSYAAMNVVKNPATEVQRKQMAMDMILDKQTPNAALAQEITSLKRSGGGGRYSSSRYSSSRSSYAKRSY